MEIHISKEELDLGLPNQIKELFDSQGNDFKIIINYYPFIITYSFLSIVVLETVSGDTDQIWEQNYMKKKDYDSTIKELIRVINKEL